MSGIETIKIIVEAEKEAGKILEDARMEASEIRKRLDSIIQEQREEILRSAKKEADAIMQRAEQEGRTEGESYEKESGERIRNLLSKASSRKGTAIDRLLSIVLEGQG